MESALVQTGMDFIAPPHCLTRRCREHGAELLACKRLPWRIGPAPLSFGSLGAHRFTAAHVSALVPRSASMYLASATAGSSSPLE